MTTFSVMVDELAAEAVRPDMRAVLATYVNQTIRDVHFRPQTNMPVNYDANRFEETLVAATDSPVLWALPSVTRFQDLESVYCREYRRYLVRKNPSVALKESNEPFAELYWYRTGPSIAFSGIVTGLHLDLSYFMFPQTLVYRASADRLIRYDPATDSYVLIAGGGAPSESQLALETNWLLQRWEHVIREGARAKLYKRLGDDVRTRMAFSSFESMRTAIWNTEASS